MGLSSGARTVFAKELVDNVRDRRTLAAALFYPLLGPAMILFVVFAVGRLTREVETPLELPVSGREHAPNLIGFDPFVNLVDYVVDEAMSNER